MPTESIPALKTARARISSDGSVIELSIELMSGEKHRVGMPREVVPDLAATLLTAWKSAEAKARAQKKN